MLRQSRNDKSAFVVIQRYLSELPLCVLRRKIGETEAGNGIHDSALPFAGITGSSGSVLCVISSLSRILIETEEGHIFCEGYHS